MIYLVIKIKSKSHILTGVPDEASRQLACNGEKQSLLSLHSITVILYDLSCTRIYTVDVRADLWISLPPDTSQLILESFSELLSLVRVYPRYSDYPSLVYQTIVSAN